MATKCKGEDDGGKITNKKIQIPPKTFFVEAAFFSLNIRTGKKQSDIRTIDRIFSYLAQPYDRETVSKLANSSVRAKKTVSGQKSRNLG